MRVETAARAAADSPYKGATYGLTTRDFRHCLPEVRGVNLWMDNHAGGMTHV